MLEPLECPYCRARVSGAELYCLDCGLGLAFEGAIVHARMPDIVRGSSLLSVSFATHPFPGRSSRTESRPGVYRFEPAPDGLVAEFGATTTGAYTDLSQSFRDACIRTVMTAYDDRARLGISVRHAVVGGGQLYYAFHVSMSRRLAYLTRSVQWPDFVAEETIAPSVVVPVAVGTPMELEVRAQGPTLRAYIDGRCVRMAHAPMFGRGGFGIRLGREEGDAPARIHCAGYEICGVAP